MSPKKAAFLTLLLFLGLFTFQLLWTHGQLERLRSLGRRGLRRHAQQQHAAAHTVAMGAELDGLGLAGDDGGASGAADEAVVYGDGQSMPNPALIVFAFNRAHYLNQTLRSLLRLRGLQRYSVYVSQAGQADGRAGGQGGRAGRPVSWPAVAWAAGALSAQPASQPKECDCRCAAGRQRYERGRCGCVAGAALPAPRPRLCAVAEDATGGSAGAQPAGACLAGAALQVGPGPAVCGEAQPRGDCGGRHAVQPRWADTIRWQRPAGGLHTHNLLCCCRPPSPSLPAPCSSKRMPAGAHARCPTPPPPSPRRLPAVL